MMTELSRDIPGTISAALKFTKKTSSPRVCYLVVSPDDREKIYGDKRYEPILQQLPLYADAAVPDGCCTASISWSPGEKETAGMTGRQRYEYTKRTAARECGRLSRLLGTGAVRTGR